MQVEQIIEIAKRAMGSSKVDIREPGYTYDHGRRTASIALHLADAHGAPVDRDVLHAAALFHDIGKGNNRHNEVGARLVRELLEHACSPAEIDRISQIILEHPLRMKPNSYTLETKLIQDADVLDHIGPIGPWRTFYVSAAQDKTLDCVLEYYHSDENIESLEWMREALNLNESVVIFDKRAAFERQFFAELERVQRQGI
jgi:uncharacterized protein